MKTLVPLVMILVFAAIIGCSGGGSSPIDPASEQPRTSQSSHMLWGLWQFTVDPVAETIDIVQLRDADMHVNVLPFLEPPPFVNLTLESLVIDGNMVEAGIGLRHPFMGLNEFTGFDVCGIFIADGSVTGFTNPDLRLPGPGDTRLLNADGHSRWWNPHEFPVGKGMFNYVDGLLGTPDAIADFNATLNGYKFFCDDLDGPDDPVNGINPESRCVFTAGTKCVRHYSIEMGAGLIFNYAVDANWQFPDGPKPWEVPDSFGPEANRTEAWNISVTETTNSLFNDGVINGGNLSLLIDVWDHFNAELNTVYVESPGNFSPAGPLSPLGGGTGYSTYQVDITSATPAQGSIGVLITAECEAVGYGDILPGEPLSAYYLHTAQVSEEGNQAPIAIVEVLPDLDHYICDLVTFDASDSYDPDGGVITYYEFDWDNDGTYDESGTDPVATHSWPTVGTYYVQVRVTDDEATTDELDDPLEIDIVPIGEPMFIVNLQGTLHSPFCAKVDTVDNNGWVDCTQALPVKDFGFYRIDEDENIEKIFEKSGGGFFGMPGVYGLNSEARKIIASDLLGLDGMGYAKCDIWDLDGGPDLQFNIPFDSTAGGIAFIMDSELYGDLSVAVVCDSAPMSYGRLVTWDYTESSPTFTDHQMSAEFPNALEADYEGHRLFAFCRGTNGPGPTVEVYDAEDWSNITSFQSSLAHFGLFNEIDYHPSLSQLYIACDDVGSFEVWDTDTYTHIQNVNTGLPQINSVDHMGCGIYVAGPEHLLVYDANTLALLYDVPGPANPFMLACNPNNRKIYIPDDTTQGLYVFQG